MRHLDLYCLISILLSSCIFEPDEYFHVNSNLNRLGNFKKGSYWIYHNDVLNINDTITVIDYSTAMHGENYDSHQRYYDHVTIKMKSTFHDSIVIDELSGHCYYSRRYIQKSTSMDSLDSEGFEIISTPQYSFFPTYYSHTGSLNMIVGYNLGGSAYDTILTYTTTKQKMFYFTLDKGIFRMIRNINNKKLDWLLTECKIIR